MKKVITVKEKSVYGKTLIYPYCNDSNYFSLLAGVKTFSMQQLKLIEDLGYIVNLIKL